MESLGTLIVVGHRQPISNGHLWHSRYSVPGFGFWRELSIRCFARPMLLIASCLSNAANLHNELSRVAPQASHQLRRACEIMWRLQHGISLKTAKGPFVLCPCHCSFKTSAMPTASKKTLTSETQLGYIASTSGLACHFRPCLPAGPCWASCTSGLAGPSARPALLASFRVLT